MQPLPSSRRIVLPLLSVATALLLAPVARATWTESGDVDITILTPTTQYVEANQVQPGNVMGVVSIGDGLYETTGEVTVVGEGSPVARKQLGLWSIQYGTGNIQSVIGTVNVIWVGESAAETAMPGVLHVLASDLDGGGIRVYKGTLTVDGGSKVNDVEVFDDSSAYVTLFSRIGNLTTYEGAYAKLQESISSSTGYCTQRGTVLIEDSLLRCGIAQIWSDAHVEIHPAVTTSSTLEVTGVLSINNQASLSVLGTDATTGSIAMGGDDTDFSIGSSRWTNAGELAFETSSVVGPVQMTIGTDTQFNNGGTARVAGHPAWQHLTVTDAGTELEIDGDLRIGEYLNFQHHLADFSGNVTVANGATVIVHGALVIRPLGVLNLESGSTVYAASLANGGTINENGGTLVVPEPANALAGASALLALALRSRPRS